MERYLEISPEVKAALEEGKPVVALESTIISHGMPYPKNVQTALEVEEVVRQSGAVPATIAAGTNRTFKCICRKICQQWESNPMDIPTRKSRAYRV